VPRNTLKITGGVVYLYQKGSKYPKLPSLLNRSQGSHLRSLCHGTRQLSTRWLKALASEWNKHHKGFRPKRDVWMKNWFDVVLVSRP
jgi:hypothetical protein